MLVLAAAPRASAILRDMTSCIVAAFAALRFPRPEGGKATTVEYRLSFQPGE
jgi:hypothetical protein